MTDIQEKQFDYTPVDPETAEELKGLKLEHNQNTNSYAFRTGKILHRAKQLLQENPECAEAYEELLGDLGISEEDIKKLLLVNGGQGRQ